MAHSHKEVMETLVWFLSFPKQATHTVSWWFIFLLQGNPRSLFSPYFTKEKMLEGDLPEPQNSYYKPRPIHTLCLSCSGGTWRKDVPSRQEPCGLAGVQRVEPESSQPRATLPKADKYYRHIQAGGRPRRKKTYDICMTGCGIIHIYIHFKFCAHKSTYELDFCHNRTSHKIEI